MQLQNESIYHKTLRGNYPEHPVWSRTKDIKITVELALIYPVGAGGNFISGQITKNYKQNNLNEYFSDSKWFYPDSSINDYKFSDLQLLDFLYTSRQYDTDISEKIMLAHVPPVWTNDLYNLHIDQMFYLYVRPEDSWYTIVLTLIKNMFSADYKKHNSVLEILEYLDGLKITYHHAYQIDQLADYLGEFGIQTTSPIIYCYIGYCIRNSLDITVETLDMFATDFIDNYVRDRVDIFDYCGLNHVLQDQLDFFSRVTDVKQVEYFSFYRGADKYGCDLIDNIDRKMLHEYHVTNLQSVHRVFKWLPDQMQEKFLKYSNEYGLLNV